MAAAAAATLEPSDAPASKTLFAQLAVAGETVADKPLRLNEDVVASLVPEALAMTFASPEDAFVLVGDADRGGLGAVATSADNTSMERAAWWQLARALGDAALWSVTGGVATSEVRTYVLFARATDARKWNTAARALRKNKADVVAYSNTVNLLPDTLMVVMFDRGANGGGASYWRVHVLLFERRKRLTRQALLYARFVIVPDAVFSLSTERRTAQQLDHVPVLDALVVRRGGMQRAFSLYAGVVNGALDPLRGPKPPSTLSLLTYSQYVGSALAVVPGVTGIGGKTSVVALTMEVRATQASEIDDDSQLELATLVPRLRAYYAAYEAKAGVPPGREGVTVRAASGVPVRVTETLGGAVSSGYPTLAYLITLADRGADLLVWESNANYGAVLGAVTASAAAAAPLQLLDSTSA